MPTATKPSFLDKHTGDMFCVSFGVLAIIVFLAVSFAWYDATSLPQHKRSIAEVQVHSGEVNQSDQPKALGAIANPQSQKATYEFVHKPTADNAMWRYTVDGWQDISMITNQSQKAKPFLEVINPLIWAALMVLASMLLLVMASSKKEVNRIFGEPKEQKAKS